MAGFVLADARRPCPRYVFTSEQDDMTRIAVCLFSALLLVAPAIAEDAPPGIKRTPLQSIDFPEGYKTVTGLAEVAPGHASGMHTHPGIETGYVLDGEVLMIVEGQPDRKLKAGDSFVIP